MLKHLVLVDPGPLSTQAVLADGDGSPVKQDVRSLSVDGPQVHGHD